MARVRKGPKAFVAPSKSLPRTGGEGNRPARFVVVDGACEKDNNG